ncbi:hypothetical protein AAFF_G00031000 [Aldrovandia affinis]|uniref:Uncharacterized protein n=1 Tax=Aldrovandia affinis TaxID=143900 RepID=A0AAD7S492_9TELE|nr:hypothetical protein AAFF_G00031000 [Aldrovandia affinis]
MARGVGVGRGWQQEAEREFLLLLASRGQGRGEVGQSPVGDLIAALHQRWTDFSVYAFPAPRRSVPIVPPGRSLAWNTASGLIKTHASSEMCTRLYLVPLGLRNQPVSSDSTSRESASRTC